MELAISPFWMTLYGPTHGVLRDPLRVPAVEDIPRCCNIFENIYNGSLNRLRGVSEPEVYIWELKKSNVCDDGCLCDLVRMN
jgi:hypothetical protein